MAILTTVIGTKGIDKALKLSRGAGAVDDAARVSSLSDDAARLGSLSDEVGHGGRAGRFANPTGRAISDAERIVAQVLVDEGRVVEVLSEGSVRTADFLVDGVPTEIKTITNITSSDVSAALSRRILDGAGQAGHIIIDGRGQAGMTQAVAERAIRRAYGADRTQRRLQNIRIIGPDFDITVPYIP